MTLKNSSGGVITSYSIHYTKLYDPYNQREVQCPDKPERFFWSGWNIRLHDVHRIQLPELARLAKRVEHVHGERADCPNGLAAHLELMRDELENHMQKEEQILFPLLKSGNYEFARGPIMVMQHEHDDHGQNLDVILRLTNRNNFV